jgi:octopine/nopaline transport system permease protein
MDPAFLWEVLLTLLPGVPTTLMLASLSVLFGFLISAPVAAMRLWGPSWAKRVASGYVFLFRSTPLLVQIFLIYYGVGQFEAVRDSILWPFLREPFWCAILALSLNTGAYGSEILRGGFMSVPPGQIESGRACGMTAWKCFRRVTFPLAIRQALPGYGNELVLMVKSTSLASIITLLDITGLAAKLISETYRVIEVFLVAGAIYLALNIVLTACVAFIDRRLTAHLRPPNTPSPVAAPGDQA